MATDMIQREIQIDAPVDRVWAVLTEAKHIAGWFGDSVEIDLRPGGKALFTWSGHGTYHAVVERVEPPVVFAYRWARNAGNDPAAADSTLVEFTLAAAGDGTLLTVVETGFAGWAATEEEQDKGAAENTQGWGEELGELKEYAERLA
jgi:uncharacterized protein YndB with AHSA1/START domain